MFDIQGQIEFFYVLYRTVYVCVHCTSTRGAIKFLYKLTLNLWNKPVIISLFTKKNLAILLQHFVLKKLCRFSAHLSTLNSWLTVIYAHFYE